MDRWLTAWACVHRVNSYTKRRKGKGMGTVSVNTFRISQYLHPNGIDAVSVFLVVSPGYTRAWVILFVRHICGVCIDKLSFSPSFEASYIIRNFTNVICILSRQGVLLFANSTSALRTHKGGLSFCICPILKRHPRFTFPSGAVIVVFTIIPIRICLACFSIPRAPSGIAPETVSQRFANVDACAFLASAFGTNQRRSAFSVRPIFESSPFLLPPFSEMIPVFLAIFLSAVICAACPVDRAPIWVAIVVHVKMVSEFGESRIHRSNPQNQAGDPKRIIHPKK